MQSKKHRVLLLGGTRFIGREIARLCLQYGHELCLFNRGQTDQSCPYMTIHGDLANLCDYREQFVKFAPDVVIHCLSHTEHDAHRFIETFRGINAKLIVLSSCDCYEVFQQLNRGHEVSDFPVSEDMPLSSIRHYWKDINPNHSGGPEYDKNLMTDVLMKAHAQGEARVTVFRLPQVYGPGDHQAGYRHGPIIRRILDRRKNLVLSSLKQNQLCTFGYVENIAAAVVHSIDHEVTDGKIYNLGETSVRSKRRWAELYAQAASWSFEIHILPDEIMDGDTKYRNYPPQHLIFDCGLFLRDTGFREPVDLEAAIHRTLDWGQKNPDRLGPKGLDYAREDELIRDYGLAMNSLFEKTAK